MCCTIGSIGARSLVNSSLMSVQRWSAASALMYSWKKSGAAPPAPEAELPVFSRPANLVQPGSQRDESFIGKFGGPW